MKKYNYIASAKRTLKIESDSIKSISNQLDNSFEELCDKVINSNGKFIIMGVGKSGHIAQKISATLSSTGTPSIFIHPTEAAHGDMGLIEKKDIVLLISNSGESDEIIQILSSLKRLSKKIGSITSNKNSTIAKNSDFPLILKSKEACPMNLAPTSSTTACLALGDAIAIALLEAKGFTSKDFASSHPAGKLGRRLITKVSDLMQSGKSIPLVNDETILSDALLEISEKKLGLTLIQNKSKKVIGIFTDGDLRRCIGEKRDINNTKIHEVMTKNFIKVSENTLAIDAAKIMEENKIFTLVVLDNQIYSIYFLYCIVDSAMRSFNSCFLFIHRT